MALPSSTAIAHYFQNKYKGIEVEVHRNGSQRVLQRFMQEASAGIKNADIVHTSDAGNFELLKDKGMLLKFTPQGVAGFPGGVVSECVPQGGWTQQAADVIGAKRWTAVRASCHAASAIEFAAFAI